MGRRIVTKKIESNFRDVKDVTIDNFFDQIIKYIPSDIVSAWIAVTGLIDSASDAIPKNKLLWILFIIIIAITVIWTWMQTNEPNKSPAYRQIFISTTAFIVLVFALGGPFATLKWYQPLYGSLCLIVYSLILTLLIKMGISD